MVLAYRYNPTEPPKIVLKPRRRKRQWRPQDEVDWNSRIHHRRVTNAAADRLKALRAMQLCSVESGLTGSDGEPAQETNNMAKKAKATKKTAAPKAAKGPGVIATIIDCISKEKGATADEIVAVLVKTFPDREEAGMRKTTIIQANRNCSSKDKDEKRGLVYFKRR
jgi:hypothetical protein